jgi:hypothetical protein
VACGDGPLHAADGYRRQHSKLRREQRAGGARSKRTVAAQLAGQPVLGLTQVVVCTDAPARLAPAAAVTPLQTSWGDLCALLSCAGLLTPGQRRCQGLPLAPTAAEEAATHPAGPRSHVAPQHASLHGRLRL